MIRYIYNIKYVGNSVFTINSSIGATYNDLINSENYMDYKKELTVFMRKLKLLKLAGKDDYSLYDTIIYSARFKPTGNMGDFDFASLYPHSMKTFAHVVPNNRVELYDDIIKNYKRKKIIKEKSEN